MRPTVSVLREWNPDTIRLAGESAQNAASKLDGALDIARRAMDKPVHWEGQTHDAAQAKITAECDHAHEVRNVLNQIADESKDAAENLTHSRKFILDEVDPALARGCRVTDDGFVSHADVDEADFASTQQAKIQNGLTTLSGYDDEYGSRLRDLKIDLMRMYSGQPDITLPDGHKMDPDKVVDMLKTFNQDQVREYLSRLSPADLRHLIQANPEEMGNLDGVPFGARATANEVNIRNALADERRAGRGQKPRAKQLETMLTSIPDPGARKSHTPSIPITADNHGDDNLVERKYISFSNTKNGHFVEMIGEFEPGTKSATVVIPGTNTNLDGSEGNHRSAWNMAHLTGGPVFVYADGDLPQSFAGEKGALSGARIGGPFGVAGTVAGAFGGLVGDHGDSAASGALAGKIAPGIVDFGRELDSEIAIHSPEAKTTFIGHSYGGSALGTAEQLGLRSDRVIYASSAGTGVLDTPWRNANPNVERYSLTAPGDSIQYVQGMPFGPHGGDPDTAPGVERIDTGTYGPDDENSPGHADGEHVRGGGGHGGYWNDPSSTAFDNMLKVIKGEQPTPYVERESDHYQADSVKDKADAAADQARDVAAAAAKAAAEKIIKDSLRFPDIPLRLK